MFSTQSTAIYISLNMADIKVNVSIYVCLNDSLFHQEAVSWFLFPSSVRLVAHPVQVGLPNSEEENHERSREQLPHEQNHPKDDVAGVAQS